MGFLEGREPLACSLCSHYRTKAQKAEAEVEQRKREVEALVHTSAKRLREEHKAQVEGLRNRLADADRYGDHMAALMNHVDKPASCAVCSCPATCISWCLDDGVQAMCDDHCGHGNKDSTCYPVPPTREAAKAEGGG